MKKSGEEPLSPSKPARGRIMSIFQERRESTYQQQTAYDPNKDEEQIYGDLDASLTLMLHGLESDWIEEEMADDDDFK